MTTYVQIFIHDIVSPTVGISPKKDISSISFSLSHFEIIIGIQALYIILHIY